MSDKVSKVALCVETSLGYGRNFLRGVIRYARLYGPWSFYLQPVDLHEFSWQMEKWGGTGIIASVETHEVAKAVLSARLPTIFLDLSCAQLAPIDSQSRLSKICPNSYKAGAVAAEYFMDHGFRHFGFVGVCGNVPWSISRGEGFARRLLEAGLSNVCFPSTSIAARDRRWDCEQAVLAQWLGQLPKPLAILACDDDRGRQVIEACRAAGLQVPEDVAVVGIGNDELLCELSNPTLSSVALNTEKVGYDAAALLHGLMMRRIREPRRILVEPTHVVTRRSSDVHVSEDRIVAKAMQFINDNIDRPFGVMDIVKHIDCSRRALELRFRDNLGRSVNSEIQLIRLERTKQLLMETDMTVAQIADSLGYNSSNYMIRFFHKKVGCSPAEYRARLRECEANILDIVIGSV